MNQTLKKLAIIIITSFSFINANGIKTIDAQNAHHGNFFDYEDYDKDGNPIGEVSFLKGCSWYCAGEVSEIRVSSNLNESNGINYSAQNAHDFQTKTAWIEGKEDYGVGEWIEYDFNFKDRGYPDSALGVNKIILANGYWKSEPLWKANSRIKKLKMYVNGKPTAILKLLDIYKLQTLNFEVIRFPSKETTTIKFEIMEVYPGTKYKDTAISELVFDGVGDH